MNMCVRLHIHPNLHTVYALVCVCGGGGAGGAGLCACMRSCVQATLCECEGIVFECVSV